MFKYIRFTFFKWDVSIDLGALRAWNDCKVFRAESTWHLVWGKLSVHIENWTLEIHPICGECNSIEIGNVSAGDESWTVCQNCRSIEQSIKYVNLREYDKAS